MPPFVPCWDLLLGQNDARPHRVLPFTPAVRLHGERFQKYDFSAAWAPNRVPNLAHPSPRYPGPFNVSPCPLVGGPTELVQGPGPIGIQFWTAEKEPSCGVGVRRLCLGGRKEKETAGGVGGSRVTHFTNPNGMEENQTQHGVTGYMESGGPDRTIHTTIYFIWTFVLL